jgi:hypothetical protein
MDQNGGEHCVVHGIRFGTHKGVEVFFAFGEVVH